MKLCNAKDIMAMAHLVNRTPQGYDRFIVCSPFISEDLLLSKIISLESIRVPTTIITSPECSVNLINTIKRCPDLLNIISAPNLHAKVYWALLMLPGQLLTKTMSRCPHHWGNTRRNRIDVRPGKQIGKDYQKLRLRSVTYEKHE